MKNLYSTIVILIVLSVHFIQCSEPGANIGDDAPTFSASTPGGDRMELSACRGKYVLITFWSDCCPGFQYAFPEMESIYENLHSGDFELLGVNVGQSRGIVDSTGKGYQITFPLLLDEHYDVAKRYAIATVPANVLISPEGKIIDIHYGWASEPYIRDAIDRTRSGKKGQAS